MAPSCEFGLRPVRLRQLPRHLREVRDATGHFPARVHRDLGEGGGVITLTNIKAAKTTKKLVMARTETDRCGVFWGYGGRPVYSDRIRSAPKFALARRLLAFGPALGSPQAA